MYPSGRVREQDTIAQTDREVYRLAVDYKTMLTVVLAFVLPINPQLAQRSTQLSKQNVLVNLCAGLENP